MDKNTPAVSVVGGDARQTEVARLFVEAGADVRAAGVPGAEALAGATLCTSLDAALEGAALAVAPVQGEGPDGLIYSAASAAPPLRLTRSNLSAMAPCACLGIGIGNPRLQALCAEAGVRLLAYRERDEFAILNAIPSAEGAIAVAMHRLDRTLHGSEAVVLGFGRTGAVLCRALSGLGARVTAVARRPEHLARAVAEGYQPCAFERLRTVLPRADVIFNTVPVRVLDRDLLSEVRAGCPILDLASAPGGADFGTAAELGVDAMLLPGLPGKVAPRSAGRYVFDVVLDLVRSTGASWTHALAPAHPDAESAPTRRR